MAPRSLTLTAAVAPEAVAHRLVRRPGGVWLDGRGDCAGTLCWSPSRKITPGPDWVAEARAALGAQDPRPVIDGRPRFAGGLVGWIGYEAGRWAERMPEARSAPALPELHLARYEGALHHLGGARWLAVGPPALIEEAEAALADAARGEAVWTGAARVDLAPADAHGPDAMGARWLPPPPSGVRVVEDGDPAGFLRAVRQALQGIAAGDLYQVNLARRIVLGGVSDPFAVWLRLRAATPAPYGAWMALEEGALLSNSPELYLSLRGGEAKSLPIKGTRPLGVGPREQALHWLALTEDPKERAELTMIVDLVRNDLGRVCQPGSVRADPREVRAWPTLLHAEQAVYGRLRPGLDALDLVQASFPPGSVTGAPKVQAMSLIRALEPTRRGVYTGCVGWLSDGGDARLSVAIRVAQVGGAGRPADEARVHVGCGVVADSKPEAELAESQLKALALLRAFGASLPATPPLDPPTRAAARSPAWAPGRAR